MKYNISKTTPPPMPNLGRGTECVALLLSQVSKDMQQSIVPMLFPILGAHVSGAEFMSFIASMPVFGCKRGCFGAQVCQLPSAYYYKSE